MAAKKQTKRAPRQVWLVLDEYGLVQDAFKRQTDAAAVAGSTWRVAGPYVLAERVREQ